MRLRNNTMAEHADRHYLYQESVQDTEAEIDFVEETWDRLRDRPAELLREDFCGTGNTACEWVRRDPTHYAVGVDLDPEVLEWGELNNIAQLDEEQQSRIELLREDVVNTLPEPADIVLAMNFSYYLFPTRTEMLEYFRNVRRGLTDDGIFFLDAYGGPDAQQSQIEQRECDGFEYIWEQHSFDPIQNRGVNYIHFAFPDGSELRQAFAYEWRIWSLPEIREILLDAGFSKTEVYWEGTDRETGQGNDVFTRRERAHADPAWVAHLVAIP